jgi:hypothetical protein
MVHTQEMDPEANDEALASHFDRLNDYEDGRTPLGELAGDELYEHIQQSGDAVVSFSHFLPRCAPPAPAPPISSSRLHPQPAPPPGGLLDHRPRHFHQRHQRCHQSARALTAVGGLCDRLELLPEKRFLFFPNLAKVVGSTLLGERVEALRPDVHIFGHTHFGWCVPRHPPSSSLSLSHPLSQAEMTTPPKVDTKCTAPSLIPTVNGNGSQLLYSRTSVRSPRKL